jgi:DNA-binding response OmpR family regulator
MRKHRPAADAGDPRRPAHVVMPGMNGRDLADRIGVMRPGLKILFMSGYSTEAVEAHGVLARGTTFLEKPFSPDVLLRKIRDVLDT